jgi:hypothetical protein
MLIKNVFRSIQSFYRAKNIYANLIFIFVGYVTAI